MQLLDSLQIHQGEAIAFVGAGGKTSLVAAFAQTLPGPVVITATTHLGAWQTDIADHHAIVAAPDDINHIEWNTNQTLLITGQPGADDRLKGLNDNEIADLITICQDRHITLLIESDGAKQLNLKAPTDYEPVIPNRVDQVVIVAGLLGLARPLTAEFVHRPEVFSRISGIPIGEPVTLEGLALVLASPAGGLKGIPQHARTTLWLNQADTPHLRSLGQRLSRRLSPHFDAILVGSLNHPDAGGPVFASQKRVAVVVLAAGGSRRLGTPKQLLPWEGVPFIRQIVQTALQAELEKVIVITGSDRVEVESALSGLPVETIYNEHWQRGQSTSMQLGLTSLPDRCDGVLFMLSDQPQTSVILLRQLVERFSETGASIVAPQVNQQRGNPVLFSNEVFHSLLQINGDQGGRSLLSAHSVEWLPWIDDRSFLDVDSEADLAYLKEAYFGTV